VTRAGKGITARGAAAARISLGHLSRLYPKVKKYLAEMGIRAKVRSAMFLTCLILASTSNRAEQAAEPMHVQAARAIFRLEHQETITRPGEVKAERVLKADGTAFVIEHDDRLYLVTARHVAEQSYDLRARVPSRRNDTGATEVVELRIPKESWVFHELGPEERKEGDKIIWLRGVDVAVSPIPGIKDRSIVKFRSCNPCPSGESSQLATTDPVPPSSVLIAGFPGDLGFALLEQRPMFRSGIVSIVAGDRFLSVEGAFADERSFVIDSKIERGNSGSPVFSVNQFSGAITLVGLVSAVNQASDFGVAEPASRIREALERAKGSHRDSGPEWHLLSQ